MPGWAAALLDTSGRNQLIFCKPSGKIELGRLPDGTRSGADPAVVARLLAGGPVAISGLFPSTPTPMAQADISQRSKFLQAAKAAKSMRQRIRLYEEERGVQVGRLATGFVTWQDPKNREPAAPLFLRYLTVAQPQPGVEDFQVQLAAEVEINQVLLHVMRRDYGLRLSKEQVSDLQDAVETSASLAGYRDALAEFATLAAAANVPGFVSAPDRLLMGVLQYQKLPMVQDLETHPELFEVSDLVAAVAGDSASMQRLRSAGGAGEGVTRDLPDRTPPSDEWLVLDADPSQSYVINASVAGVNLVVQGPPGTGKSQTISNLVASHVARGKRVLFVAEKRAAIDAVLSRLADQGLRDMVLDLHDGAADKGRVNDEIKRAIASARTALAPDVRANHRTLVETRASLVGHADATHVPREPWGVSLFDAQAVQLGTPIEARTEVRLTGQVLARVDEPACRRVRTLLGEASDLGAFLPQGERGAWAAATTLVQTDAPRVFDLARRAAFETLPQVLPVLDDVLAATGLPDPHCVRDWQHALQLLAELDALALMWTPEVWEADLDRLHQLIGNRAYRKAQHVDADWAERRRAKKSIRAMRREHDGPRGDLHADVGRTLAFRDHWRGLGAVWPPVQPPQTTGPSPTATAGGPTLLPGAALASTLAPAFNDVAALSEVLHGIDLASTDLRQVREVAVRLAADPTQLTRQARVNEIIAELQSLGLQALLQDLTKRTAKWSSAAGSLTAAEGSAGRAADRLRGLTLACWDHCWHASITDQVSLLDTRVATFSGAVQHQTVHCFQEADKTHRDTTPARIRRVVAERLTDTRSRKSDQDQFLDVELSRKRKIKTLRDLLRRAPEVILASKPCWAMSPLVVSEVLPAIPGLFDLVVFDEASQIRPADAIPALARAKQVVVAGDSKQMPPTSFFDESAAGGADAPLAGPDPRTRGRRARSVAADADGDGYDDLTGQLLPDGPVDLDAAADGEQVDQASSASQAVIDGAVSDDAESLLDVMNAVLGERLANEFYLGWHYRSQDERLIAFSNRWFYNTDLLTFPGVSVESPLRFEHVEQMPGMPNQEDSVSAEVSRVVELVVEHAENRPDESLGLIAMSLKHAQRIDAALQARITTLPSAVRSFFSETREDPFFIKNLERVQGDERDAILLTTGWGKTSDGRMLYRFGPVSQDGGERRLNVAFTRARRRMTMVASFTADDLDPAKIKSDGAKALRAYLQYVQSGGANLGDKATDRPLNPFESHLLDRLGRAGIPVIPQYGVSGYFIDFVAQHPNKPGRMILAIEADGASYHSSETARARDRLRQEHLERLGWHFCRVWSTDYFRDPDVEIARIKAAYDLAVAAADLDSEPDSQRPRAERAAALTEPTRTRVSATIEDPDGGGTLSTSASADTARSVPRPRDNRGGDASAAPTVPCQLRPPGQAPVIPGGTIRDYSDRQLNAVVRWVRSDGLLRTDDELLTDCMDIMGFSRRGKTIVERLTAAIRRTR